MVRSRDRTQRPQGTSERERQRERERTDGAHRENPRIGEATTAMVIIWTVTDTDSFPPGADQGQTVSSWGRAEREKDRGQVGLRERTPGSERTVLSAHIREQEATCIS